MRSTRAIGIGWLDTAPGSVKALHLVVTDVHAARAELIGRGVDVGEVTEISAPGKPTVSYAAWASGEAGGMWWACRASISQVKSGAREGAAGWPLMVASSWR
jgi:hypothetical protein